MNKPRILVVEDNPIEQKLIGLLAQRYGVQADIAGTGYRALQLLDDEHAYAAVLMNFMLPAMSGLECTQLIRQTEVGSSRHVPIIAVTAAVTEGSRSVCEEVGMDDYLPKPYSVEEFGALLERWVLNDIEASA